MVVACMHTTPIAAACHRHRKAESAWQHLRPLQGVPITRVFDDCAVLATAVAWREPRVSAEMAPIGSVVL